MIEGLIGHVLRKSENKVTINVKGVIYGVNVHSNITEIEYGGVEESYLPVTAIYTEKSQKLYGHEDEIEQELFLKLLKVERIGASVIMKIFNQVKYYSLIQMIKSGDVDKIKIIKGIGPRMAANIIETLQGKL